jgi:hypothetical protein
LLTTLWKTQKTELSIRKQIYSRQTLRKIDQSLFEIFIFRGFRNENGFNGTQRIPVRQWTGYACVGRILQTHRFSLLFFQSQSQPWTSVSSPGNCIFFTDKHITLLQVTSYELKRGRSIAEISL